MCTVLYYYYYYYFCISISISTICIVNAYFLYINTAVYYIYYLCRSTCSCMWVHVCMYNTYMYVYIHVVCTCVCMQYVYTCSYCLQFYFLIDLIKNTFAPCIKCCCTSTNFRDSSNINFAAQLCCHSKCFFRQFTGSSNSKSPNLSFQT